MAHSEDIAGQSDEELEDEKDKITSDTDESLVEHQPQGDANSNDGDWDTGTTKSV